MKNHKQQKNKRFAHLATQIATIRNFYKSKESIYLTFLAFIFIFSAYLHLTYYGSSDIKGDFFGFTWMSSFLFAIALPLTILSSSLIFASCSRRNNDPFLKLLSLSGTVSGCFYFVWTFWTMPDDFKDLSKTSYFTILIVLTIIFFFLVKQVDKYANRTEIELRARIEQFRTIIENLISFIWSKKDDSLEPKKYAREAVKTLQDNKVV